MKKLIIVVFALLVSACGGMKMDTYTYPPFTIVDVIPSDRAQGACFIRFTDTVGYSYFTTGSKPSFCSYKPGDRWLQGN